MQNIPNLIIVLFIITTIATIYLFYRASNNKPIVLFTLILLAIIQAKIALTGFFQNTQTIPPRLTLLIGPPLLIILYLFISRKGKEFIDGISIQQLTLLHIIRIPVEICLLYLFIGKMIPEIMTFEGYNFDIISGITAPLIYLAFKYNKINNTILLIWNFICLALLINIVTIALLSVPTPFQKLAFDQPNKGITYFPFVWLPGIVVPLVLLSHLVCIRKLMLNRNLVSKSRSQESGIGIRV